MHYIVAADLDDAIRLRRETEYMLLAGGTDLYPAIEGGLRVPGVIDVSKVAALRGDIALRDDAWTFPALATWSDVVAADLPGEFDLLKQAAAEIGGRQIQNTGTIGGNICNASPAADGIAALLALDATLVLSGPSGDRETPLEAFVLGSRRVDLREGEMLRAVRVPAREGRYAGGFEKLGARRYLVISIVMVAALLEVDRVGAVRSAAIAVGACADRAVRLRAWERALVGRSVADAAAMPIDAAALAPLRPIDDIRGSASYRRHAAEALVRDALAGLAGRLA